MEKLIEKKRLIEKKKSERDQLLGQKGMVEKELKKQGFSTIKEAKESLDSLEIEIDEMDIEFEKSLNAFEEKYKGLLYGTDTSD